MAGHGVGDLGGAGGVHRVHIRGDSVASGTVVWCHRNPSPSPGASRCPTTRSRGSTLVTIDLLANGGGTLVRLTQELVPDGFDAVRRGWEHYLDRLVVVAGGGDPGPDPYPGFPARR